MAGSDDMAIQEIRELGGVPLVVDCLKEKDVRVAAAASGALLNIATDDQSREQIRENKGLELLFSFLAKNTTDATTVEYVLGCLINMCGDEESRTIISSNVKDAGDTLLKCLKDKNALEETKRNTLVILTQLSMDADFTHQMIKCGIMKELIALFDAPEDLYRNRASTCLWNTCICSEEAIQFLIENNCVPKLLKVLSNSKSENTDTISNCVIILSFMCQQSPDILSNEANALDVVVNLLTYPRDSVSQNAAAAIWNIGDLDEIKYELASLKTIPGLITLMGNFVKSKQNDALEKVLGALITCCALEEMSLQFGEYKKGEGFSFLKQIIEERMQKVAINKKDKALAFSTLMFSILSYKIENREGIRGCGVLNQLLELLSKPGVEVECIEHASSAILNLSRDTQTRPIIQQAKGIEALAKLLNHTNNKVQKNAAGSLWLMSTDSSIKEEIEKLGQYTTLEKVVNSAKEKR